jgi:hypothetical protein
VPTRKCPSCGAVFDISDRLAGRTFACDACGKQLAPPRLLPSPGAPRHNPAPDPCKSCGRFVRDRVPCPGCKDVFCSEACVSCHVKITGHRVAVNPLPFVGAGVLAALLLAYCCGAFGPGRRESSVNRTADFPSPSPARAPAPREPTQVDPDIFQPQAPPTETVADATLPVAHATPVAPAAPGYVTPSLPPQAGDSPAAGSAAAAGSPKTSNVPGYLRKDGGYIRPHAPANK